MEAWLQSHVTPNGPEKQKKRVVRVRKILRARRAREKLFADGTFADPAWDILLYAYVAYLVGEKLLVSDLCLDSGVPLTTALRWIGKLETDAMLSRRSDLPNVGETCVELTREGAFIMDSYFNSVPVDVCV